MVCPLMVRGPHHELEGGSLTTSGNEAASPETIYFHGNDSESDPFLTTISVDDIMWVV